MPRCRGDHRRRAGAHSARWPSSARRVDDSFRSVAVRAVSPGFRSQPRSASHTSAPFGKLAAKARRAVITPKRLSLITQTLEISISTSTWTTRWSNCWCRTAQASTTMTCVASVGHGSRTGPARARPLVAGSGFAASFATPRFACTGEAWRSSHCCAPALPAKPCGRPAETVASDSPPRHDGVTGHKLAPLWRDRVAWPRGVDTRGKRGGLDTVDDVRLASRQSRDLPARRCPAPLPRRQSSPLRVRPVEG